MRVYRCFVLLFCFLSQFFSSEIDPQTFHLGVREGVVMTLKARITETKQGKGLWGRERGFQ